MAAYRFRFFTLPPHHHTPHRAHNQHVRIAHSLASANHTDLQHKPPNFRLCRRRYHRPCCQRFCQPVWSAAATAAAPAAALVSSFHSQENGRKVLTELVNPTGFPYIPYSQADVEYGNWGRPVMSFFHYIQLCRANLSTLLVAGVEASEGYTSLGRLLPECSPNKFGKRKKRARICIHPGSFEVVIDQ